ncbi:MAG: DUF2177 family protein [Sedimentisphaerales bacterium]|nr:DUF2177 family protein [Sedimentisphaerales bacterium]
MQISRILLTYIVSVPVFFIVDMIWLGVIAKGFYRKALEPLMTPNINWVAAIIFYLLFLVGVLIFALLPGMEKKSLLHTIVMAALFGFIAYATYDLTNLATLRDWPLMLSIVDMIWGSFLSASTATITYLIMSRISPM